MRTGTIPEHRATAGAQRSAAPRVVDEKTIAPGEIRTPDPLVRRETRTRDNTDRGRQHATDASSARPARQGKSALDRASAARAGTIPEPPASLQCDGRRWWPIDITRIQHGPRSDVRQRTNDELVAFVSGSLTLRDFQRISTGRPGLADQLPSTSAAASSEGVSGVRDLKNDVAAHARSHLGLRVRGNNACSHDMVGTSDGGKTYKCNWCGKVMSRSTRLGPRGYVLLDVVLWSPLSALLFAVVCLLAFNVSKDERAADRQQRAELVAIAEECLDGWEKTIGDLNVCADVREHYEAGNACSGSYANMACTCWKAPSPVFIGGR